MNRKEILVDLYCTKRMTQKEMAVLLGYDQGNLSREMAKLGLPARSYSESQKQYWKSGADTTKQLANLVPGGNKGYPRSLQANASVSLAIKGIPRHSYDDAFKLKASLSHKGKVGYWLGKKRPEVNRWLNNDQARARSMQALHLKPNKVEKRLDTILQKYSPGEWKFTGDGSVIIGGLCPDFTNVNGRKATIEVFGNYWHNSQKRQLKPSQTGDGRIAIFKNFGFKLLILWEHEINKLPETEIINRVKTLEAM